MEGHASYLDMTDYETALAFHEGAARCFVTYLGNTCTRVVPVCVAVVCLVL